MCIARQNSSIKIVLAQYNFLKECKTKKAIISDGFLNFAPQTGLEPVLVPNVSF
jgi:hypothetical protein